MIDTSTFSMLLAGASSACPSLRSSPCRRRLIPLPSGPEGQLEGKRSPSWRNCSDEISPWHRC